MKALQKPLQYSLLTGSGAVALAILCSPLAAQTLPAAPPAAWLDYKGDAQRTGAVDVRLGAAPNLVWRHSTDVEPKRYDTSPLVIGPPGQRRIYFAIDRTIFCLNGQTGEQIWRSQPLTRPIASPITHMPGEAGDIILAVTSSGQVNALRTSDGAEVWQTGTGAPVQNVAPLLINTAGGERIMLAQSTGRLIALTPQGQLDPSWEVRLGSFATTPTATPALSHDGRLLYIPSQDKRLYVVNAADARLEFPINLRFGAYTSPLITHNKILLVTGTTLNSMLLRTGQSDWMFDVKSTLTAPAARHDGSTIFVGARNGRFYGVDATTGAERWSTDLADSVTGTPTVTDDMVLVGTRNGMLFGLAPEDGRVLWRYRLQTERIDTRDRDRERDSAGNDSTTRRDSRRSGRGRGRDRRANQPAVQQIWEDTDTATHGVSGQPVVLGDHVYLLADNAALYAFSTQPFDAAPPQVSNPRLSVPSSTPPRPVLLQMDTEKPLLVPGQAPIELTAEITDAGSGVDPESIRITLNEQPLPQSAITSFQDSSGKLLVKLAEQQVHVTTQLEDGMYNLGITARDYRGNEMSYSIHFLVDNSVRPPALPEAPRRTDTDNNR